MTPLFYIPGFCRGSVKLADLPPETGLLTPLEGLALGAAEILGPDDNKGTLLAPRWKAVDASITSGEYNKDTQDWFPIRPEGKEVTHWVGWPKGKPPGPEDLVRSNPPPCGGHKLQLLDGNSWVIPVCGPVPKFNRLPWVPVLDANGNIDADIPSRWLPLQELSLQWFIKSYTDDLNYGPLELLQYSSALLAANYRVYPALLLGPLQLVDSPTFNKMVDISIGGIEIRAENVAVGKADTAQDT